MNSYNIFKIKSNYIPFGVCMLILSIIISIAVFTKDIIELALYDSPVVLDLNESISESQKDRILTFLKNDALINSSSIEYIDKSQSAEVMRGQMDTMLFRKVYALNVFRDIIVFKFKTDVIDKNLRNEFLDLVIDMGGVKEVNTASGSVIDQNNWIRNINMILWPFVVFFAIILIMVIRSLLKHNVFSNREIMQTLSLAGENKNDIFFTYLRSKLDLLIKSWFLSVLLFIIGFYLMISRFNISIYDIGLIKFIVVLILPLLIFIIAIGVFSYFYIGKE